MYIRSVAGFIVSQRKVHARTGCDACSDCASGKNNARHAGVRDGRVRPKGNYGGALESATVTKFHGNMKVERGKPHKRETQIW